MSDEMSIDALVSRFFELRRQGQSVTPDELCADRPEQAEELRLRVEAMASMEGFLELTNLGSRGDVFGPTLAPTQIVEHRPPAVGSTRPLDGEPTTPALVRPPEHCPRDYEILSQLGEGGMGVVYKARQKSLNRVVALKMILSRGRNADQMIARFRQEAEAIARLQHPNIVQVYEFGEEEGVPYFALEFVEGGSLDRVIAGTPQPGAAAAGIVATLADAMHAAHQ